jgi:hypothetical protein
LRLVATAVAATLLTSCSSSSSGASACLVNGALPGAAYDITKSRFAFGSTPVKSHLGSAVVWMGTDGSVGITPNGYESAALSSVAPQASLPGLVPPDGDATASYAAAYYETMGLESCEVGLSANEIPWEIGRNLQGIAVVESIGQAVFDVDGQTTTEAFYWPEIPADAVASAIAFQARLSDPSALAAYKSKLPPYAQSVGAVVIHHTDRYSDTAPFQAVATYDVKLPFNFDAGLGDEEPPTSFDVNGNPATLPP